jgi:hypothetical protein
MKREVGVWIDRHKAVMVTVVGEQEETREVRSNVISHLKPLTKLELNHSKVSLVANIDGALHHQSDHFSGYFSGVVSMLRNADLIWIFGPGEAKIELKMYLERENLGGRIVCIEDVNKMTDRQIVAKVRQYYLQ